jgi:hypothetical protein
MRPRVLPALLVALASAACGASTAPPSGESAVVVFVFDGRPADTLRVRVADAATVLEAERVIAGLSEARIPSGPIVRGAGEDPRYPFHFVSGEVRLVEAAMELCDGVPMRTAAEVEEYFLGATGNPRARRAPWCPWSARPLRVE